MTNGQEAAFPSVPLQPTHLGLTKREYAAIMAMRGIVSSYTGLLPSAETLVNKSLEYADALLKALG